MQIAKELTNLKAIDYASQGNSIIGIRGSGKTYTATKVAEQLMEEGIPIIAFDPTGIWQNLRNGINGKPGYPIVVAGGKFPDLPLTEENAKEIVGAALKQGVSLVIDLLGVSTSNKSKWIRIVSSCVEFLLEHNEQYGIRHIFLEEAAEFVPQRPNPGGQLVYSRIESMARIGRNFGLGYTLINQRAEEVAKAIFEISEMVLVGRQSGKNSLNSIRDWLKVRNDDQEADIIQSLPKLFNGQFWAINEQQSVLINVLPKNTFHPSPKEGKATLPANVKPANAQAFIDGMKKLLSAPGVEKHKQGEDVKEAPVFLEEIDKLKKENIRLDALLVAAEQKRVRLFNALAEINHLIISAIEPDHDVDEFTLGTREDGTTKLVPLEKTSTPTLTTNGNPIRLNSASGLMRMLRAAAMFPKGISRTRMALIAGMSPKSGSFGTYLASLRKDNLIVDKDGELVITAEGKLRAGKVDRPGDLTEMWCTILGANGGAARILRKLKKNYPEGLNRKELAAGVNMSDTSGSFGTYLSTLRRNKLIQDIGKKLKLSDELI